MLKTNGLHVRGIKTHRIVPGESFEAILDRYLPLLKEKTIVAITSKIVSLCQNQVIPKSQVPDKQALVQQEADAYLDEEQPHGIYLTIKNHIIIPTAGIDESNVEDAYVLYPKDIPGTTASIWDYLRKRDGVSELGVVLTDSHTTPFRRGITGIALGWCGFLPLHDYVGKPDLYGKPLRVSMANLVDGIASAAVLIMGEGNEQTPLCVLDGMHNIHFQDRPPTQEELDSVSIALEDDIYAPLLRHKRWLKKPKTKLKSVK
ncbi:MAG TPA: coenzyme F420-0:L-glutamate ligase [Gammaproteobacteria bacterium]|nr:coenzyme F420-0:L-glutamate ligase [Gammaproteobacteria bacterium]